jgi:hypothetical protein
MKQYDLTEDEYIEFMEAQEYRCPICLTDFEALGQEPAIDHDHSTGAVRGLLCRKCNLGIGNLQDNPEVLRAAIHYLVSHSLLG